MCVLNASWFICTGSGLVYFDPFLVSKCHPCFRAALVLWQVLVVFHEPLECIDRLFDALFADGRPTDFMASIIALRISSDGRYSNIVKLK